jgi:hypothetical protein
VKLQTQNEPENQVAVYWQQDGYREMGAANCHLTHDEEIIFAAAKV